MRRRTRHLGPTTTAAQAAVALAAVALAVAGCTSGGSSSATTTPATAPPATTPAAPATTTPATSAPTTPATPSSGPTGTPTGAQDVVTGLSVPWGIAFLPQGDALVTLRDDARIIDVAPDGTTTPITGAGADQLRRTVVHQGEGGLLGIAVLTPATGDQAEIAVYATTDSDNRVLRGTLTGHSLGALTPILTGIHKASNHDGGRLAVGPDGYLYVTTGDATDRPTAQDRSTLNGKILRITPDGDPAPDNPFPGSPVWSYGHRNVQGIGWSADGRMFASEFGQDTWDELNLIVKGANYGWPTVEGIAHDGRFHDPLVQWHTDEASPSGIAVTPDAVYLAALHGARLWRVPLTATGVGTPQAFFTGTYGRLRAVAVSPSGELWVLTNNTDGRGRPKPGDDRIVRLTFG
ncbi:PQQ-dependent sugar dehydrogenase [Cellulomonas alba]|uniref:PQQ-dependent sugar dehydrogenase n=1 Tax=Cellulomonas alba TaxID=3053467 RepID=A0ABT7SH87_9CELL|nr:PQQ-dependent sugar dehydrogenase [Cellulomonas alba]MDM7855551.1 PQQ-dependent sugar dehydrogenase [Cellulomonas alba]